MKKLRLKYNGGYIDNIEVDTTLYEVSKRVKGDFKYSIVGARLGEFLVDLNTKVTKNDTVEFYDLSSKYGNKIYSRSLEFLLTAAFRKLYPDGDVLINYSLENGLYCEVTSKKINSITVKKLEDKMHDMVKEELPFTNMIVDRFDAIEYFKKHHQMDKVDSLRYITNKTVTLYCLDDIYDYFYGPLVYNTKILDKFEILYLKENSFILVHPNAENPNKLKPYVDHKLTFNTYKNYQKWGRLIGISTAPQLNKICTMGRDADVVRLFETHYEDQLSAVAEEISKNRDRIKIVLLAGPSSSGKTTTSKKLAFYLGVKGINSKKISLDDYFVDRIYSPKDEFGNYDYSDIKALDVKLFKRQLARMLKGQKVLMPTYDFVAGKKVYTDNYMKLNDGEILVIEGIHTLNEKLTDIIPRENKYKIFMSPLIHLNLDNHNRVHSTDVRKLRRMVRDNLYRGTSAEETLAMWPNVDKEALKNIYPFQDDADAMINSSLGYEVNVLRTYAEPLLYGIESSSPVYPEAVRLIDLLRNFLTITSEVVPSDSILREFIGGSVFKD